MKIIVVVTAADITAGVPKDSYFCPVGIAGRRALMRKQLTEKQLLIGIPSIAVDFMRRFDNGDKVDPIKFEWDLGPQ